MRACASSVHLRYVLSLSIDLLRPVNLKSYVRLASLPFQVPTFYLKGKMRKGGGGASGKKTTELFSN